MKADSRITAEVTAVLENLATAYAKRDITTLLANFAPDPDVVMYGTGADEKRVGLAEIKAQAERDWAQAEAAAIKQDTVSVSAAGSVAWAAVDGAFEVMAGGQEMAVPARITYTLEKRGDKWLVVQAHFSVPMAGQEEGESFPT